MDTPEVKTESTSSENGDTKREPSEAAAASLTLPKSTKQKKGKHSLVLSLHIYALSLLSAIYQPLIAPFF